MKFGGDGSGRRDKRVRKMLLGMSVPVGKFRTANIGKFGSKRQLRVKKARRRRRKGMKKDARHQTCLLRENMRKHKQEKLDMEKKHAQELTRLLQEFEAKKALLEEEANERRRELSRQGELALYA